MKWRNFPVVSLASLIFFSVGYFTGDWSKVWIIWLFIPIVNFFIRQSEHGKSDEHQNQSKQAKESKKDEWSEF